MTSMLDLPGVLESHLQLELVNFRRHSELAGARPTEEGAADALRDKLDH